MIQSFLALTLNGFREARRNRVTLAVGAFAILALVSSTLVTGVTLQTYPRVLCDVGLGSMNLILVFLAIFLSSGLLAREIERRTIFLIVSKPLSRTQFLLARLCGNLLTLLVLLVTMGVIFIGEMALNSVAITQPQLIAMVGLFFELVLLSSIGFLFSSFTTQMVSAIATCGLYFAGHLSTDIYRLSAHSQDTLIRSLGKAAYYVLPNLERLDFRPMATYGVHLPASVVLSAAGYALAYSAGLLAIATVIFNRRDFR